jgi:hypothetical protein
VRIRREAVILLVGIHLLDLFFDPGGSMVVRNVGTVLPSHTTSSCRNATVFITRFILGKLIKFISSIVPSQNEKFLTRV